MGTPCPLCEAPDTEPFHRSRTRRFLQCARCRLVLVPPDEWVDRDAEKARYDQHQNDAADPRYRAFLSRLADPLLARLPAGSRGLDFGCGPGPALPQMLAERGMIVRVFDPFYAPDETVWQERYDFVAATEVVEHLQRPRHELTRLFDALVPGGWLAVMTRWVGGLESFAASRYIRDPTHICFYGPDTFRWIAAHWRATLVLPAPDVALLKREV